MENCDPNEAMVQRALFEVRVPGVSAKEEVCISGNVRALGEWAVHRSVPMTWRDGTPDVWQVELEIPTDVTLQYRYLVVQRFMSGGKEIMDVIRWETTLHPRYLCLRETERKADIPDASEDALFVKQDGFFGENEIGEKAQDDGWLTGTSELHLQLHSSGSHPIHLDTLPGGEHYSVRIQAINYCAKTEEVCEVCQCSPIRVKVLDREKGDCIFQSQGKHGCLYLPHQMLVYYTRAPTFSYCAFVVDLFNSDGLSVGRASILPQQLKSSHDKLVLTVFSSELLPMGTITFTYLITHTVKDVPRIHRTRHSYAKYWKQHKRPLDIGHRGLGNSHEIKDGLKPSATENTIASLRKAGAHGADYVEFDLQLTKDLVPVVYHDFTVCTTLARRGFSSGELYLVHVKDLTLSQLHNLKLDHSSILEGRRESFDASNAEEASDTDSYLSSEDELETSWGQKSGSYIEEPPERKTFPTLVKVFKSLPAHIGFNIEVKYPVSETVDPQYNFSYFERNQMADIILKVVYRHAHKRKIIFSCFDPDMCTMLRLKQPKYPVLFLSNGILKPSVPVDIRGQTLNDATMFAKADKLLGVNLDSASLLSNLDLVSKVTDKNLVLFTWGEKNDTPEVIELQKKRGVAAVIYDRITHMIPQQKNVFEDEEEEEEDEEEGHGCEGHTTT